LERLSAAREGAYTAAADAVVDTDNCSVEQVADAVLLAFAESGA
jgi:hypothetical protein